MNLKKKLKKLLAFDRCSEGGFTLVELVVVIAILGILGGVGTVGYSGYVKKANIAADEVLLSNLNMAFATACALNGESHINRTNKPTATITEGLATVDAKDLAINGFFEELYENGEFKVYTGLAFVPENRGLLRGGL